jgi:putative lipoprotein
MCFPNTCHRRGSIVLRFLSLCLTAALAFALLPAAAATARTLRGDVTYRERIALDAKAVITVELVELASAEGPETVIASQTIRPRGRQVPISFRLNYPRSEIDRGGHYTLQARIEVDGALRFANAEPVNVDPLATTGPVLVVVNGVQADAEKTPPSSPASLQGTEWRAQQIEGRKVLDIVQSTLSIEAGGRISGSAGCNRYFGTASVKDGVISVGPLGATQMACVPEQMEQEKRFLDALGKTSGFRVDEGQLVLLDKAGSPLMQLVKNGKG